MPQIKRFIFIRHGATDWNIGLLKLGPQDYGLNDLGEEQALETAKKIKHILSSQENNYSILSSNLSRAKKTAEIISKYNNNLPISFDNDLNEIYYGDHSKNKVLDQEPLKKFHDRIRNVIDNIISPINESLIIISHLGVFKALKEILVPTPIISLDNGAGAIFWQTESVWTVDLIDNRPYANWD